MPFGIVTGPSFDFNVPDEVPWLEWSVKVTVLIVIPSNHNVEIPYLSLQ